MAKIFVEPKYDLRKLVANVYDISRPAGMGFLHYTPGSLTEEQITALIDLEASFPVAMDYVLGRQCKFYVYYEGGVQSPDKLCFDDEWYDHSSAELMELLIRSAK